MGLAQLYKVSINSASGEALELVGCGENCNDPKKVSINSASGEALELYAFLVIGLIQGFPLIPLRVKR